MLLCAAYRVVSEIAYLLSKWVARVLKRKLWMSMARWSQMRGGLVILSGK
jgi:hypothetical protein